MDAKSDPKSPGADMYAHWRTVYGLRLSLSEEFWLDRTFLGSTLLLYAFACTKVYQSVLLFVVFRFLVSLR